jgi:hypothetical protein
MIFHRLSVVLLGCLVAAGCSSDAQFGTARDSAEKKADAPASSDDASETKGPLSDAEKLLAGGDPAAATITELFRAPDNMFCETLSRACPGLGVDLDFNPAHEGELWAVFRQPYGGEPCDTPPEGATSAGPDQAGCALLRSKVAIFADATVNKPQVELKEDGNAWHFMRLVTALSFADDETFATVGEARTGNYFDVPIDFMGPTLWSSKPEIFAQDFMLNGSHLDMLHATPFGMGIAHQRDHVFWAFNGDVGSIDRYDFHKPHVPGGEDHSDGEYAQYVTGQVKRLDGVPSHMAFMSDNRTLVIADSGNQRIVELDTESGTSDVAMTTEDPQIADPRMVLGAELVELIPPGVMVLPSGLAVWHDYVLSTDAETSLIHLFDSSGKELLTFDTGLDSGTLAGITVGPDDKVYFVDWPKARVLRIDVD